MAELKKCPFCGGKAKLYYAPVNVVMKISCFGVSCESCKVMIGTVAAGKTDFFRTPDEAAEAWNRRAAE